MSAMVEADAGIPCVLMRGGTSRGGYFLHTDLPGDEAARDELLVRVMGSPHALQVDGIGGGHPLTSKVAVVSPSDHPDADVDYLFLQVVVNQPVASALQPCGNILAGIGPFAIERGLVPATTPVTQVRIRMVNSDRTVVATVDTPDGRPIYRGGTSISGVEEPAAPIPLQFGDLAGAICDGLFPTGNRIDEVDGIPVTCIDNGMPIVAMRARDLGISGHESVEEMEANTELRVRVEAIRLQTGRLMGLGDVTDATIPKMTIVAPPTAGGALSTRSFIPHRCHRSIGVFAAVSVASAVALDDTVASEIPGPGEDGLVRIEHPTGYFDVGIELTADGAGVARSSVMRTARKIFEGTVWPVPVGGDHA
jgi:4-oxalomesaconate tautomerase